MPVATAAGTSWMSQPKASAAMRASVVLPKPDSPLNMKACADFFCTMRSSDLTTASWPYTSLNACGRYVL